MSGKNKIETRSKVDGLSKRESWWYGFFGGMISVLVANGVVDVQKIEKIITTSTQPYLNLGTILFVSMVTALIAGFWVMVQRPIHSALIAVQLGVIAPSAIIATLDIAGSRYVRSTSIPSLTTPAYAKNISNSPSHLEQILTSPAYKKSGQKRQKPTIDCFIKSILRQVC